MARKKVKRYDKGGEIVVSGSRAEDARALDRMMREPSFVGGGGDFGGGMRGGMGDGMGGSSDTIAPRSLRAPARSTGPQLTPTAIKQSRSTLGRLTGTAAPKGYGVNLKIPFKKGGAVKKMAKGGSTASKRADGCATKGKTKGRFV
jgi:hypothetical protein